MTYPLTLTAAQLALLEEVLEDFDDADMVEDEDNDTFSELVALVAELTHIARLQAADAHPASSPTLAPVVSLPTPTTDNRYIEHSDPFGDDPYDERDATEGPGHLVVHPVTKDCPHITYPQTGITHMTDGVLRCDACQGEYDNVHH